MAAPLAVLKMIGKLAAGMAASGLQKASDVKGQQAAGQPTSTAQQVSDLASGVGTGIRAAAQGIGDVTRGSNEKARQQALAELEPGGLDEPIVRGPMRAQDFSAMSEEELQRYLSGLK